MTESEQPTAAGLDETLSETVESPIAETEPAWPSCSSCGAEVAPEDGYCEQCGADLLVRRSDPVAPAGGPCRNAECPGESFTDGYCDVCGAPAPDPRDHYERDLGAVAGVTDRGLRHSRNEDDMSLAVIGGGAALTTVAVVCDGVSTSYKPETASAAAAYTAREHLVLALRRGEDPQQATLGAFEQAHKAVVALPADPTDLGNGRASTMVSVVAGDRGITVGWVGDARVYWLDRNPEDSLVLTLDDSWAGRMIADGTLTEEEAFKSPLAHTILRWLGPGAPEEPANLRVFLPDGPGLVLACSDGLWNYVPDAADLARLAAGGFGGLLPTANAMANVALEGGGHDNITAVLVPWPPTAPAPGGDNTAEIEGISS
ncbi:MAG TPA: protein phosphatase 2C domain-containing protein [Actinospica sp.]|nr:protein phosphatase 2C domain-containing protein [Actinospica sp.]